ncbi:hypothetical protein GIB67_011298 [Kingdonia uniflora]|uniref:Uncharacterized protein n=1 Tax=Kingdonia uniflora TaxID=39325 RepID=A0A7J7MNV2_9MAGN|nr:hypothetical protein GIB67_011298 [Kingdonia uniflora]
MTEGNTALIASSRRKKAYGKALLALRIMRTISVTIRLANNPKVNYQKFNIHNQPQRTSRLLTINN